MSPHSTLLSVGPRRLMHRRAAIPKPAEKFLYTFYFPLRRFGCAGTANALLTCGWVLRGRPSSSQQHPWERAAFLAGGGDLPMGCCGSADQIRHRWATQSCHNQPGFENVIIGMVNKFTRTPLRQGIAMVTDQKSLGRRKVSISGGSGRGGAAGTPGMLPRSLLAPWCGAELGAGPCCWATTTPLSAAVPSGTELPKTKQALTIPACG